MNEANKLLFYKYIKYIKNLEKELMKIGILTHHYVKNFGAYMQATALISVIRENYPDADVELIDYRVAIHEKLNTRHFFGFNPQRGDSIDGFIQKIRLYSTHKKYENGLPRSKRVLVADDINALHYDIIIIGSDEVWNFNDIAYSPLKFGIGIECPHISYSASAGGSTALDTNIPLELKKGIRSFQDIAVRDEKTEELVMALTGRKAERTLDPVYLCEFQLKISEKIKKWSTSKPYILVYDCRLGKKQIEAIVQYAKQSNLNILGAGEYRKWYSTTDTVNITPYEWAYLFKNAEAVITGTFHGTSFSIKYNRPFAVYLTEQNRVNKVGSLLKEFGLENQIVDDEGDLVEIMTQQIDYSLVNQVIDRRKRESLDYLFKNIEKVSYKCMKK